MQKAAKSKDRDQNQKFVSNVEEELQEEDLDAWETIFEVDVEEFDCSESLSECDVELLEEYEDESDAASLQTDLEQAILSVNEMQWTRKAKAAEKQMPAVLGESDRSRRRHEFDHKKTKESAKSTRSILEFLVRNPQEFPTAGNSSDSEEYFKPPLTPGEVDVEDMETIRSAIERLKVEAVAAQSSNAKLEQRNKKITKWEYTQYLSVLRYFQFRLENGKGKMDAAEEVAKVIFNKRGHSSYKAQCIRNWAKFYIRNGYLPVHQQGKHAKTFSIIHDEKVCEILKSELRKMTDSQRTPQTFVALLNTNLLKELPGGAPESVTEETATIWMRYLGFEREEAKKGYYTDGHEREDVVTYRAEFLEKMKDYERRMGHWAGPDMNEFCSPCESLREGEKEVVLVTHDEMIVHANDATKYFWQEHSSTKSIRPKSNGSSLMVSGFSCVCHGFHGGTTSHIMKPGKNRDGYWTNAMLVEQLEKVIPIFQAAHPGKTLLFAFDNSQNHHAKHPRALTTSHLNLTDGGASDKFFLRDTVYNGKEQKMQFEDRFGKLHQKGLKRILQERDCWPPSCGSSVRGAKFDLEKHPDFMNEKIWLQEVIENSGHEMIFYPKFHCELNYIEMVWAYVKKDLRSKCTFSYPDLQSRLPQALNDVPMAYFKRVSRHCFRFMQGYRDGLVGPLLDYAIRKYSGHRAIPQDQLTIVKEEYEQRLSRKRQRDA